MSKAELNELVEDLIFIRDVFPMSSNARKRIADACNVIDGNLDVLADDKNGEKK